MGVGAMKYSRRLVLYVIVINLFVLAVVGQSLRISYNNHVQTALATATNIGALLARDLNSEFDAIDEALLVAADQYARPFSSDLTDEFGLSALLRRQTVRNAAMQSLCIANAQGVVTVGLDGDQSPHASIKDRAFFIAQRDTPSAGLIISKPIVNEKSGKSVIVFSRRLTHADGTFAGVVFADVGMEHINANFSNVPVGSKGSVALRDAQLGLMVRVPHIEGARTSDFNPIAVALQGAVQRNPQAGTFVIERAPIDNITRVYAYHRLSHYPYYVIIGLSRHDFLRPWFHELAILTALIVLFSLMTSWGRWLLLGAWAQRKQALVALRKSQALTDSSEERFRLAMQANVDGLWDSGDGSDNGYFSPAYYHMLGYQPGAFPMNGSAWSELIHPEDWQRVIDANQECFENRTQHFEVEFRMRAKDGSWCWVLSRGAAAHRDTSGQALRMIGTHQNITPRKTAEQALLAAQQDVARASNAKSRFLAAASHDLRQPLAAMSLYVEVLKIKLQPTDAKLLANMERCIGGLSHLLNDLLDISRLDAEVVIPEASRFPVADLLSRLVAVRTPWALEKGLRLRCRPSALQAHTDPVLLANMLERIITNAIRYSEHGGVLIACRHRQGKTWIEVWDSGIGIAPDLIPLVFEEYLQAHPDNPRRNGNFMGSGLGLAIVAKTASLLDLEIRVQSRLGRGSVFAIELPLG